MTDVTEQTEVKEETVSNEPEVTIGITADQIANMTDEEIEKLNPTQLATSAEEAQPQEPVNTGSEPSQEQTTTDTNQQVTELENNTTLSDQDFRQMITSPFRANNTEVRVEKPEDVIKFMQMGMNYQKKLGAIRPHLGALKSLEQNGLLDNDKINFMIELMQGKAEAVAQFIKEKGIDTYSLPDVSEQDYKPANYIPTEQQLTFNEAVDDIKDSETGRLVLSDVNSWDEESISEIYNTPRLLKTLQSHAETGLYQDTMSILTREMALGNITGSIIDAYDNVATQLLNTSNKYIQRPNTQVTQNQPVVVGNNLQPQQQVINQNPAKQVAQITNGYSSQPVNYVDPMVIANMSDEDFEKFGTFEQLVQKVQLRR